MYINSASSISPQRSFRQMDPLTGLKALSGNRFTCEEPDYMQLIEPKLIRRMSRIIRMGVATAMDALEQAGVKDPSAIITGTAYGCLEDTGIFLQRMVENKEEMLTPTAFIQSTHNTVGAQVALLLKCHSYNNTYVQRGHSFETALLDTMLLLGENPAASVLVGSADETTNQSFVLLERFGLFRHQASGEGACYFVAGVSPAAGSLAKMAGLKTIFQPGDHAVEKAVHSLLSQNGMKPADIHILLTGRTNEPSTATYYGMVEKTIFPLTPAGQFKSLCGEYPTASAFAFWLAAKILKQQSVPSIICPSFTGQLKNILIYNIDTAGYHSLMLLTAC
ncbi:beta-ketoacyl synthase chain length factor [Flavihumibacter profundi]|uniref:beta-ketoacyl synthase chain length factor n=1 Tax=Flavihumibacter profundi TaxID=2716883 RepID=UPI001CC71075|nr:beta-ketoacyl synthase chain length factor [Flavihumibacter profundi]MBZ5858856.1 beta-ketoacyl synthase chain length factor [Flavihumibacter profundi]